MPDIAQASADLQTARRMVEEATPKGRLSTRSHSQAHQITSALAKLALRIAPVLELSATPNKE